MAGITTAQAKTRLLESTSRNVDTHSYSPQYLNTVRNSQTLTVYPGMNLKLHVSLQSSIICANRIIVLFYESIQEESLC